MSKTAKTLSFQFNIVMMVVIGDQLHLALILQDMALLMEMIDGLQWV